MKVVDSIITTENVFGAEIVVNSCRLLFTISIDDVRQGKSLNAAKNAWVKEVLDSNHMWVSEDTLRSAAKDMVVVLRDVIEGYMELEQQEAEDQDDQDDQNNE